MICLAPSFQIGFNVCLSFDVKLATLENPIINKFYYKALGYCGINFDKFKFLLIVKERVDLLL